MATEKLEWVKVDPASLPESLKAKWVALVMARDAEKKAKAEFEAAFISASNKAKKIPQGKIVLFGYRFGGLAISLTDKENESKVTKGASAWF
jgi:hypothetical protein